MPFPVYSFMKKVNRLKAIIGNDKTAGANGGFAFPVANQYQALYDGIIKTMNYYFISASPGLSFSLGVYDDLAGKPNNLLGTTEIITLTNNVNNRYVTKDLISDVPIQQNQLIWLGSRFDAGFVNRYQTGNLALSRSLIGAGATLPDPFVESDRIIRSIAFYADVIYYP